MLSRGVISETLTLEVSSGLNSSFIWRTGSAILALLSHPPGFPILPSSSEVCNFLCILSELWEVFFQWLSAQMETRD